MSGLMSGVSEQQDTKRDMVGEEPNGSPLTKHIPRMSSKATASWLELSAVRTFESTPIHQYLRSSVFISVRAAGCSRFSLSSLQIAYK